MLKRQIEVTRNELQPLRVAVKQALHATRMARLSSSGRAIERRLRMGAFWTALALAPVLMVALPQSAAAQTAWTGSTERGREERKGDEEQKTWAADCPTPMIGALGTMATGPQN